jgi:hypothetical protein
MNTINLLFKEFQLKVKIMPKLLPKYSVRTKNISLESNIRVLKKIQL